MGSGRGRAAAKDGKVGEAAARKAERKSGRQGRGIREVRRGKKNLPARTAHVTMKRNA